MLKISNSDPLETLRKLKSIGLNSTFLVPTTTGLSKSILDATKPIVNYFRENQIHNYDEQLQGPEYKVLIDTKLILGQDFLKTKTSLYRPITKSGDPRIWISGLNNYAQAGDLLALINNNGTLIVINCTTENLDKFSKSSIYSELRYNRKANNISIELLEKLTAISSRGFVKSLRNGDTGIGFTLETLLGITANSNKAPDYKGIELKTKRGQQSSNRSTLFSKTPDWNQSRLKSSRDILFERGRFNEERNRHQLYHQIDALKPNSYGLVLSLNENKNILEQRFIDDDKDIIDVIWDLNVLSTALKEKHRETFWISAKCRGSQKNQDEEFWYNHVKHTGNIDPSAFNTLIELGLISVDYLIKETPTGGVKDQGYLFKMHTSNLDLLFDQVIEYDLSSL